MNRQHEYPKSKLEAKAAGSSLFFDGNPCIHGHIAQRYIGNSGCSECAKKRALARYLKRKSELGPKPRKKARQQKELPSRSPEKQREYKLAYLERVRNDPERLEQRRKKIRERAALRHRSNVAVKISSAFGNRIRYALRKDGKTTRQILKEFCGYTIEQLIYHLEKQFSGSMSWSNYGKEWHIDHIIPVSDFRIMEIGDSEFKACWSLGNLRPLPTTENLTKKAKRLFLV